MSPHPPSHVRHEILVIGVGNEFRGDDAVGLAVVRQVRAAERPSVRCVESDGNGTALMALWEGRGRVYVVDAVRSGQKALGAIHRLVTGSKSAPLPLAGWSRSSHAFGLGEAIELSRTLGKLPTELILFGIEVDRFDIGSALSQQSRHAAQTAAGRLLDEVGGGATKHHCVLETNI